MGEYDIPTEQWAQVIEKTGGPVDYKKIPVQKPASDEVLVNIKFSGVCHTDLHAVNGDWPLVGQAFCSTTNLYIADDPSRQPNYLLSEATKAPALSSQRATSSTTSKSVTTPVSNGSTGPASPVASANKPTSPYARSPSSPATLSTAPFSNTASPKRLTWQGSLSIATSLPWHPSCALASPCTRA
jgi:hypothetical protein